MKTDTDTTQTTDDAHASAERPGEKPFSERMVTISMQEYVDLKWKANFYFEKFCEAAAHWRRDVALIKEEMAQHDQHAKETIADLEAKLEKAYARIRSLVHSLFESKSEKSKGASEKQSSESGGSDSSGGSGGKTKRRRGQQTGTHGHGRTGSENLPTVFETIDLPEKDKVCPCCNLPLASFPDTEEVEIVEIEVRAYRRLYRRKRYKPTCKCDAVPGIVTAPGPPKIIPKGGGAYNQADAGGFIKLNALRMRIAANAKRKI